MNGIFWRKFLQSGWLKLILVFGLGFGCMRYCHSLSNSALVEVRECVSDSYISRGNPGKMMVTRMEFFDNSVGGDNAVVYWEERLGQAAENTAAKTDPVQKGIILGLDVEDRSRNVVVYKWTEGGSTKTNGHQFRFELDFSKTPNSGVLSAPAWEMGKEPLITRRFRCKE